MIYGQDEPVLFPVADLYDSGMMGAYLSAVKDQYQRGLKDYDDFVSKYGDFASPIQKDVEYWNNNTMGPLADAVNQMYANGIDPTRSPEARAVLSRMMRNIPYAKLANIRQSAAIANEYLKNRGSMAAKGLYNDDYERWILKQNGMPDFEHWDSSVNGAWTRTSPNEYQDLNTVTKPWYDQMEKGYLYTDDAGYEWWGNTPDDVRKIAATHLPDLTTEYWQYQRDIARRMLGEGATPEQIQAQLENNIVAAASEKYTRPERREGAERKRERDYYYDAMLDDRRTANDIKAAAAKNADDYRYDILKAADLNLDGKIDDSEREAYKNAAAAAMSGTSSSGSGSATSAAEAMGTATQLTTQQILQYANNKEDFISAYNTSADNAYRKQKQLYNNLNDADKKIAVQFGKDYRTLSDKNATAEQKQAAEKRIRAYSNKRDPRFVEWRNQFISRMENYSTPAEAEWNKHNTTEGLAGNKPQTPLELRSRSRAIFERNNEIVGFTSEQKKELNKTLGYTTAKDEDGNDIVQGTMDKSREVQDIVIASATGNRSYRYKSVPKQVSRIIAGKKFKVDSDSISSRKYASATINKKRYNIVNETVVFDDKNVVSQLDKIGENVLRQYGIVKEGESYRVPISTKTGHGQGWADQDIQSIKRRQGAGGAAKMDVTTQAQQIQANIENR